MALYKAALTFRSCFITGGSRIDINRSSATNSTETSSFFHHSEKYKILSWDRFYCFVKQAVRTTRVTLNLSLTQSHSDCLRGLGEAIRVLGQ